MEPSPYQRWLDIVKSAIVGLAIGGTVGSIAFVLLVYGSGAWAYLTGANAIDILDWVKATFVVLPLITALIGALIVAGVQMRRNAHWSLPAPAEPIAEGERAATHSDQGQPA